MRMGTRATLVAYIVMCILAVLEISHPVQALTAPPSPVDTNTSSLHTYIVHVPAKHQPPAFASLRQWHLSLLAAAIGDHASAQFRLLYSYHLTMQGFAARLSPLEVLKLNGLPVVQLTFPDSTSELHTTRTPAFLGLASSHPNIVAASPPRPVPSHGESTIIGMLDSGIWPEHPSFSDRSGFPSPVPPRWKGTCESSPSFNSSLCNRKLIGARFFFRGFEASSFGIINETIEFKSPRDAIGHGSHTSSTCSGRFVPHASLTGAAPGNASGMAPLSHLAMYKVCWYGLCTSSDILAGFEAAIIDGVDVISFSIASVQLPFYQDAIAIGVFAAATHGIITSCAAGNSGPTPATVLNVAPWMFTIAASSIDRDFPAPVMLGNGKHYNGTSFWSVEKEPKQLPLMYAGDAVVPSGNASIAGKCMNPELLLPHAIKGKIVLCDEDKISAPAQRGFTIKKLGGVGMILGNSILEGEDTSTYLAHHILPATLVGYLEAGEIKQYINSTSNPTAHLQFPGTRVGIKPAPVMAAFSSRGPNPITPEILKPDVTAPGLNILAAWTRFVAPSGIPEDRRREDFNIQSGTSMACPHVAGVTALLKAVHPTWSPASIRSALMTTATAMDNTGETITDMATGAAADPFAYGSGHIHPTAAFDPGLVYNISMREYSDFLCSLNYTDAQMSIFVGTHNCSKATRRKAAGDLNYPSFSVVYNQNKSNIYERSFRRTLTNVGPANSTYRVYVERPRGVRVSVKPSKLAFVEGKEKLSYTIRFRASKLPEGRVDRAFGWVEWSDGHHRVRSPISFMWARDLQPFSKSPFPRDTTSSNKNIHPHFTIK